MGLFGKLKQNMNGGVKVQVQAPSSVAGNQVIPVTVTISTDDSRTINSVKAEIKAQAREQGITMGGGMNGMNNGVGVQSSRTMNETIAQVESREPFTIGPGETKTVNLQLYISGSAGNLNPLGQMSQVGGALGGALQALASAAQNFEHVNYIYSVHASADVEGIRIDPGDSVPIQVLPAAAAPQPTQPQPGTSQQPAAGPPQAPLPVPPVPPVPGMPAPLQPPAQPPPTTEPGPPQVP